MMISHEIIEQELTKLIAFAKKTNPIWPFASVILDEKGNRIVYATDCAHISPIYHAESLVIHALVCDLSIKNKSGFTMICTAEPDPLSASSIYWSSVIQEIGFDRVYYGTKLETLKELWPFGIDIKAADIIKHSSNQAIHVTQIQDAHACDNLFFEAKQAQIKINDNHPGMKVLSNNYKNFYSVMQDSLN